MMLTLSCARRSKEKKSRDLVLGRDNQKSLAHGQSPMICKVVLGERRRGQKLGKPGMMQDKKDLVGRRLRKHFHMKILIFGVHSVFQIQFQ